MLCSGIDFQLPVDRAAKTIVRDHSLDGALDKELRSTLATLAEGLGLVSSNKTGKAHVGFLSLFLAADLDVAGIDHHNEVAGVYMWCKDRLMFASEQIGCLDGNMAEVLVFGIDHPPLAIDLGSFSGKSLHTEFGKGRRDYGEILFLSKGKRCFLTGVILC